VKPGGDHGSLSWPTALTGQGAGPPGWSTSSSPTRWWPSSATLQTAAAW